MKYSMTTISKNGQIVIPAEIRKDAKIPGSAKFLVFTEGRDIYLKQMTPDRIKKEIELIKKITRAEKQIKEGKYVEIDPSMSPEELDDFLMKS